ncbi:MAG: endolytic transglycosylase MltG [Eubacteriales bacterium]|nr:endolytic transglycosylase MltG [Eubacteriales bacterium]
MDSFDFNEQEKKQSSDIYFSNETSIQSLEKTADKVIAKQKKSGGVGSTYLFFIIVIIVSVVVSIYAILCMNDIFAITKTKSNVTVSYSQQLESSNDAINLLSEKGLIKCKNFCKLFVKLRDGFIKSNRLGGPYEAGVYYLNGKMGLEGMLLTLQGDTATSETVTLAFPEGLTVPEIVNKLSDNDVCDKAALLSVIQSTEYSYSLVADLKASDSIPYRLEGFMFPDTYEFFIGESASSVVTKFLENGESKFTEEFKQRCNELGYTPYEIMTIASIIQKEAANDEQMKTISAVLHNRLKDKANFPTLGCQSTADYITNKVSPNLSSTSSHTADYYMAYYNTNNSSTVVGLPAGPICNPGTAAINAALYPENSDVKFFFHDTKGVMYTAKTYAEFKSKVQKYAPYLEY